MGKKSGLRGVFSLYDSQVASGLLCAFPHSGRNMPSKFSYDCSKETVLLAGDPQLDTVLQGVMTNAKATTLVAKFPRGFLDANRGTAKATYGELIPRSVTSSDFSQTFNIYSKDKQPEINDIENRIAKYWVPYHTQLAKALSNIATTNNYGVFIDWHSFKAPEDNMSTVVGLLPEIEIGTLETKSCSEEFELFLKTLFEKYGYRTSTNKIFKGRYIMETHGCRFDHIDSVQIEINRNLYLNADGLTIDEDKAKKLKQNIALIMEEVSNYIKQKNFTQTPAQNFSGAQNQAPA